MSTAPPTGFSGQLRAVSDRLTVPIPSKIRFLEELAADLQSLTHRLVADGLPPEEAQRRAAEALLPDEQALAWLDGVHASEYRRLTHRWGSERLRRAERLLLATAFFCLLVLEARAIFHADFARYASAFLWPVLGVGSGLVTMVLWKAFALWVKRDHGQPRRGLRALIALSAAPPAVALAGVWLDVVRLAGALQANPDLAGPLLLRALIQDAAILSIAILFMLFGGVAWLVFSQWLAIHEHAHRRVLSLDS
jgi:hypothetical protein